MTTAKKWDTNTLAPLAPTDSVFRAIDDDDIKGWNDVEQRWDIANGAMETRHMTPGDASGYGLSVFSEQQLAACAGAGNELVMLRTHAAQHAGCYPTWRDGIVVKVRVADLLALRFGVGASPDDCACDPIKDGHASLWTGPGWTKQDRTAALKLFGRSYVYEHPDRTRERLAATNGAASPRPASTKPAGLKP